MGLETARAIADKGYSVVIAESGDTLGSAAETLPLVGMDQGQLDASTELARALRSKLKS